MQENDHKIEFYVELTSMDLYRFSMRHTYMSASGVFGVLLSLGSWLMCWLRFDVLDTTAKLALFIIGCLFTIVQPVMLFFKSKAQIIQNKNIKDTLKYILDEDGITVVQGEQEGHVGWHEVRRKVQTSKAAYVYMSAVRAFIFPAEQCGKDFVEICTMIDEQMKKHENEDEAETAVMSGADEKAGAGDENKG